MNEGLGGHPRSQRFGIQPCLGVWLCQSGSFLVAPLVRLRFFVISYWLTVENRLVLVSPTHSALVSLLSSLAWTHTKLLFPAEASLQPGLELHWYTYSGRCHLRCEDNAQAHLFVVRCSTFVFVIWECGIRIDMD
jgi:hypothetical protein